jgi:hypothetical protein
VPVCVTDDEEDAFSVCVTDTNQPPSLLGMICKYIYTDRYIHTTL